MRERSYNSKYSFLKKEMMLFGITLMTLKKEFIR